MPQTIHYKRTSKWTWKKLFLFTCFTLLVILILFEIIFRIVFFFQYKNLHTSVSIQGSPLQISDSVLICKNLPFYVDYNRKYQNNELGMRSSLGDVFIDKKDSNDFWILLTGGSAMEGMGSNKNGGWLDITGIEDHPYNETIAFYLEQMLQKKMPDKKVKVFDAATSSYTVYQSYLRYLTLSKKLSPDWVISMDGVNDPAALTKGETVSDFIEKDWKTNPQFHYPLKFIIALTKRSAFINSLKQKLFYIKRNYRLEKAKKNDYPIRTKWMNSLAPPVKYAMLSNDIERGIESFTFWLSKYDSTLTARNQKHLLLIQPHMFLRDTTVLINAEKAVNHYYRTVYQDSLKQTFLRSIYNHFSFMDSIHKNIVTMNAVESWPGWVFVDYCHFTDDANRKIAKEIYNYIISDGKVIPFRN